MRKIVAKRLRRKASELTTNNSDVKLSPRRYWPEGTFKRILKQLKRKYNDTSKQNT